MINIPNKPRLLVHGFNLTLAPRAFCPALSAVLATLAALVCCTLAHAQIIDSTYILAVDRRVQEIDAAKDHGIRTLENEEFPNLRSAFQGTVSSP